MRDGLKRILRFFSQVDTLAHLAAVPLESQAWSFLIGAWTRALIPARLGRIRNHGRKNRINPDLSRGGRFCVRRHHLAARCRGSAGGDSNVAGAPQDYRHPRRRESDKRRHFFYLVPFRSGRRDDRRLFAGASELAVSFCRRGRHLYWSRRRLAGNAIAKAIGRSASSNNVLTSYAVRCLLQRRKAACLRNPGSRNCRHLLRVARPAYLEWADATASAACL